MGDAGYERLELSPDGSYRSEWTGIFLALEAGDPILRTHERRESGVWTLKEDVLVLTPYDAEERSFEDQKDADDFRPAAIVPRRYEATLRDDTLVLRGTCPVFATMRYCTDLYTGARRIVDVIMEPGA